MSYFDLGGREGRPDQSNLGIKNFAVKCVFPASLKSIRGLAAPSMSSCHGDIELHKS